MLIASSSEYLSSASGRRNCLEDSALLPAPTPHAHTQLAAARVPGAGGTGLANWPE
eukprot:COSAG06_NODE_324_length_17552_cov_11.946370_11_plen_56_part_00